MAKSPFTLGCLQMRYHGTPKAQLAQAVAMLEEAAGKGVKIAVMPELFKSDYFCQKLDPKNFDLAEPVNGETTQALQKIAKKSGMAIVNSIYEKAADGLYYNTIVVINNDGAVVDTFRKMHIPHDPLFEEKYYFTPGDQGFKSIETSAAKIGPLICWDQWYPEAARLTAMQGAEILCYPTAIGWHPSEKPVWEKDQVDAWETIQRSHAIANGVFVASCNRVGHEVTVGDGLEFFGHSFICDPYGRMLACGSHDKEEIVTAEIDLALIEDKRRNWPFFRDRRVDAYEGLTKRWNAK
ncbi:MAG: carbon-nitrogen hydrolase [Alphaproteobacteria bacterium]|nr:carbon-nitrogen hydrolase [Alphaproteobacteria bacterium]